MRFPTCETVGKAESSLPASYALKNCTTPAPFIPQQLSLEVGIAKEFEHSSLGHLHLTMEKKYKLDLAALAQNGNYKRSQNSTSDGQSEVTWSSSQLRSGTSMGSPLSRSNIKSSTHEPA